MIESLHHVQLAVPPGSEPRLRAFYCDLLGLTEVPKPASLAPRGGLWVRGPAVQLHLGVEEEFRPARKAHPALLVRDLDGLAERLRGAGYDVRADDLLPGYRRFYVSDPVGNRLELLEPA
ncbi:MAG: glyoxalase [Candidatus Dormibacteraeota bacterium]|nr:glyoxalase [Candidatus Dormibacteraeota bacterium]